MRRPNLEISDADRPLYRRLIVVPLVSTLVLAAMLLLLDKMLKLFDFVVREGGPVSVVWKMLANTLPEYMSLGVPIGLMLGTLLAFRRLAMSSELDVLRALGWSYGRMLRVPYLFAFGLALVNLGIVGFVQPYSQYAYEGLRYELRSGALGASIKVGEFTKLGKKDTLRIEHSQNGGRDLSGIFVHTAGEDGKVSAVTARERQLLRHRRSRHDHLPAAQWRAGHQRARLQDAARADLHQPGPADRAAQDRQFPPARRQERGTDRPRAGPHRA